MKKAVMKKWVKALRSGKYEQGTEYLNKDGKYCCLGVLCEIMGIAETRTGPDGAVSYDDIYGTLPRSVTEAAGMQTPGGKLPKLYKVKGRDTFSLADLNDRGLSFKQIALIIERSYKEL